MSENFKTMCCSLYSSCLKSLSTWLCDWSRVTMVTVFCVGLYEEAYRSSEEVLSLYRQYVSHIQQCQVSHSKALLLSYCSVDLLIIRIFLCSPILFIWSIMSSSLVEEIHAFIEFWFNSHPLFIMKALPLFLNIDTTLNSLIYIFWPPDSPLTLAPTQIAQAVQSVLLSYFSY